MSIIGKPLRAREPFVLYKTVAALTDITAQDKAYLENEFNKGRA